MLIFGTKLDEVALFSIRSAGRIGTASNPIINPHNLHIDGFYAEAMNRQYVGVIVDLDIREFSFKGIIIDDHEDINDPEDLVRLKNVINLGFVLIGKDVYANTTKVGKVKDYSLDTKSLYVQKLYVKPTLLKSFGTDELVFDRKSIIEVTDSKIVVTGPEQKMTDKVAQKLSPPSLRSANTSSMSEK
jgi:sporulation protein YlmC with PRC-barrel domain